MAAPSNESFGLKIATAFSIALSVVLLIAVYFLNQNYNESVANGDKLKKQVTDLNKSVADATNQFTEYRTKLGYLGIEDFEQAKAAMKKDEEQIRSEVKEMESEVAKTIDEFAAKLNGKGADAAQLEALKSRSRELVELYLNNSDQSYKASLARLKDLAINQAKLSTRLALEYIDVRRDLENANAINLTQRKTVEEQLAKAQTELNETIAKDERARQDLVKSVQDKSDQVASLDNRINNITNENTANAEKQAKTIANLTAVNRDIKDQIARKEDILTKPGGIVTFVDYASKTVRVSVNKAQGVRPLMKFSIFDKNAPGISTEKPKAIIELTKVGDPRLGENDSEGRIIKTFNTNDPIRYRDNIFSIGWSYDHPQRFVLIGKLDINRDSKDDRAEVIRMIEAAGGVVEFDLPPPATDRLPGQLAVARAFERIGEPLPSPTGRAAGRISALAYAYVTDTRPPLVNVGSVLPEGNREDAAFQQEVANATREARDNNVRPLALEKLLNLLGYDYTNPVEGRREAVDKAAIKQLLKPKATNTPGAASPGASTPGTATPPPDGGSVMPPQ